MANNSNLAENPWERLANGIILQAALKKIKKDPGNQDAMQEALAIERFFRSK